MSLPFLERVFVDTDITCDRGLDLKNHSTSRVPPIKDIFIISLVIPKLSTTSKMNCEAGEEVHTKSELNNDADYASRGTFIIFRKPNKKSILLKFISKLAP